MKIENLFIAVDQSIYDDDEVSPVDYALTNAYCLEHYYKRVHQEHLSMFVGFSFKICVLISYEITFGWIASLCSGWDMSQLKCFLYYHFTVHREVRIKECWEK
jgi:hypothetical protein